MCWWWVLTLCAVIKKSMHCLIRESINNPVKFIIYRQVIPLCNFKGRSPAQEKYMKRLDMWVLLIPFLTYMINVNHCNNLEINGILRRYTKLCAWPWPLLLSPAFGNTVPPRLLENCCMEDLPLDGKDQRKEKCFPTSTGLWFCDWNKFISSLVFLSTVKASVNKFVVWRRRKSFVS